MIDLTELRENPSKYKEACRLKNIAFDIDAFLALDGNYRDKRLFVEERRSRQNSFSKEIGKYKGQERDAKLSEMKVLADELKADEQSLRELEKEWLAQQLKIPSYPSKLVPEGKDDSDNKEIKRWGAPREFSFSPKDHVELGKQLDILDIERGVKVAGSRSYFLKGDGARLQRALINYAADFIAARGFTLMEPPHIVRSEAMVGTGYFPGGEESAYKLDERDADFCLIGTAEVPVTSYHMDEILGEDALPKRYAGVSPCYRREAGSYGRDTSGIYRVHQFYKVEQVIICKSDSEESAKRHHELLQNAEELVQSLNIPYRVVICSSGDMGQGQVYKNDIECWMPSRQGYGETHSCSTFHDFQARRLNLRYKNSQGKNIFCHTLNNTLMASTRFMIPILENFQESDGSIIIPEVLRPYFAGQQRITAP